MLWWWDRGTRGIFECMCKLMLKLKRKQILLVLGIGYWVSGIAMWDVCSMYNYNSNVYVSITRCIISPAPHCPWSKYYYCFNWDNMKYENMKYLCSKLWIWELLIFLELSYLNKLCKKHQWPRFKNIPWVFKRDFTRQIHVLSEMIPLFWWSPCHVWKFFKCSWWNYTYFYCILVLHICKHTQAILIDDINHIHGVHLPLWTYFKNQDGKMYIFLYLHNYPRTQKISRSLMILCTALVQDT